MRCVDVNVLVYAHRPETPDHDRWRAWLDAARADREPLGLMTAVTTGFVRIVTHPKVFDEPTPIAVALDFVAALRRSPATRSVEPGERHAEIFDDLCRRTS
ncbi:MAG: TA system VapC family ribonuclease toxin, partial [Ilumatobacteraceae bacterium]